MSCCWVSASLQRRCELQHLRQELLEQLLLQIEGQKNVLNDNNKHNHHEYNQFYCLNSFIAPQTVLDGSQPGTRGSVLRSDWLPRRHKSTQASRRATMLSVFFTRRPGTGLVRCDCSFRFGQKPVFGKRNTLQFWSMWCDSSHSGEAKGGSSQCGLGRH